MQVQYIKKFYLEIVFGLAVMLILSSGCAGGTQSGSPNGSEVKEVSSQEAFQLIQEKGNKPDFIILDVRTPEEFAAGHIQGALNINVNDAKFNEEIKKLDRNKIYLVYCRTGNRSTTAVNIMIDFGFKQIYHMINGITEWSAAGLPLVKG